MARLTVVAVGVLIALIAVFGMFKPSALVGFSNRTRGSRAGFMLSVLLRAILGVTFLIAAPGTRFPGIVTALGVLSVAMALVLSMMGHARMQRFILRWATWPAWLVRSVPVPVIVLGALPIYAAV